MKAVCKGKWRVPVASQDLKELTVEADSIEIIEEPKGFSAKNEEEALRLYHVERLAPVCPECGNTGFPTNFPAESVGGEKDDKRTVWFCRDMAHCAFPVNPETKWVKRSK